MNITTTLDPISLKDAPKNPRLLLRDGDLDIYFQSQENLCTYRDLEVERPGLDLAHNLDNPSDESGSDWN